MFRFMNKLKSRKGFTLIELIVVLAVLAVIAAIAVPRFLSVQDNAKLSADYSTVAGIAKVAELYYAEKGATPKFSELETAKYVELGLKLQSGSKVVLSDTTVAIAKITGKDQFSVTITGSVAQYPDNR